MRTIIKGKNIHIDDELREKVTIKLEKIARHKHQAEIKELEVEFSVEKNPSIEKDKLVEITVFTKGPVLRAKEASADLIASIDLAVDKLDRQIEKYKGKFYKSQNHKEHQKAAEIKQKNENEIEER